MMNPTRLAATFLVVVPLLMQIPLQAEGMMESEPVAKSGTNRWVTPVNQLLTPAGKTIELPSFRPQALALSPDGKHLVTSGKKSELLVFNPTTGEIRQRVALPSDKATEAPELAAPVILEPDKEGQLSFTGLVFSPDGKRLYLANVAGSIKVFAVAADGKFSGLFSIPLPPANAPSRKNEIPAGLACSADGTRLYVCGNLSNQLLELDATSGKVLRTWAVGVAPFDVVLVKDKAYVSNWGGRRPKDGDLAGPAGRGTVVRVDPVCQIASEGSVSVIDLKPTPATRITEILTGLHASALAVTPDQHHVLVANAGSDTLSVIDTTSDTVIETIWARQRPDDLFGAQPNALAFDKTGKKLYVCNGTQNAIAVIAFKPGKSAWLGLIPVGWFPGAVVFDQKRDQLCVANIKGLPAEKRKATGAPGLGFNSHQYTGSLTFVLVPSKRELVKHTAVALANMRYPLLREAALPPRRDQTAQPVPERVGEPSLIKHVIYIIKENRTYDQVLGDDARGNGDYSLCIFGQRITPNQHKLAREFVLLDNTYCSGILSADGHQWADSAIATDYVERNFAGWPRSYPSGGLENCADALAYSPAGFIWDNAIAHKVSFRNYGEFATSTSRWRDASRSPKPKFQDYYQQLLRGTDDLIIGCRPDIESLRPYLATNCVGWDMSVPDICRADYFIKELKAFEAAGNFPQFIMLWLPNDHTSAAKAGSPTPAAYLADNDLAMGRIVEAVSRSKFWPETAVFAIEDDPQAGWDHVSGYRTTAYVASPYTKRGAVVSTRYNQTSIIRTMELILGLPPMNQMDATATPMFDCFTNIPDLAPFTAVPNNVPLDEVNPEPKKVADAQLRKDAIVSARLPLDKPDACPEDALNRILWRAMRGPEKYPEWAVKLVEDDD